MTVQSTNGLTKHDAEMLKILSDPVLWAQAELNITPRWYQIEMLRDPSIRKVSRIGRRCGKTITMCIHILWYAFTHRKSYQMIVAPYETQVEAIFEQLRDFIDESQAMQESIAQNKRNPQFIKLKNGARIKGFTAGTKSGNQGASTRGQKANWIYFDELDYASDEDFETVYSVTLENPKAIGMWCASTPTGRRGKFYTLCTDKRAGWREFHYPATVNPHWDADMEAQNRALYSEVAYEHEVMAEFGTETIGVFNKTFIDRAKKPYEYAGLVRDPMGKCIIGIDWDKYGAATQIVVNEYSPQLEKFRVINRVEIPKSQFTLDNAVTEIIRLNNTYKPDFIYADRGYGEYQVETLHRYGMEHPETGLHKKVKGIAFSQSLEVMDPATRLKEKKPVKPFMVGQSVIVLERDLLMLSEKDTMLWQQMQDYQVIKVSVTTGQPTYSSKDEHALDAWMLTILGFTQEFPELADVVKRASYTRHFIVTEVNHRNPFKSITDPKIKAEREDGPEFQQMIKVPVGSKKIQTAIRNQQHQWMQRGKVSKGLPTRKKI